MTSKNNLQYNVYNEQVKKYFEVLHEDEQKSGRFIFFPENRVFAQISASKKGCIYQIPRFFGYNGTQSIFCSINTFKGRKTEKARRSKNNLWGIDCVMIDIDGDKSLCGREQRLIDKLTWYWDTQRLPKPNLYSFTGGGGVHLYYSFERLPAQMGSSVKKLQYSIIEKLEEILDIENDNLSFVDEQEKVHTYHVDKKVIDTQRVDRVPGSINKKTGNMCVCFSTAQPRYVYRELTSFFETDDEYEIHKVDRMKSKNKFNRCTSRLLNKRVKGLFCLAQNGKTFESCRENALFILRNSLQQLGLSYTAVEHNLFSLNSLFVEPLKASEVQSVAKSNKTYKFTNQKIIEMLNLTEDEQKIMFSKKRPGNRKQRTFTNRVNVAKLVVDGYKIPEIAEKLNVSESLVKRVRVEIQKLGGFIFWSLGCNMSLYKKFLKKSFRNKCVNFCFKKSSFCKVLDNLRRSKRTKENKSNIKDNIKSNITSDKIKDYYINKEKQVIMQQGNIISIIPKQLDLDISA